MLSNLITKLAEIQAKEGLTDKEMAEQLGCSRQLWQMTRTGKTPLNNTIQQGIAKNFPEFHQDIIYFLSQSADKLSGEGDRKPLSLSPEPQDRGLKRFCVELIGRIKRTWKL